jgi:copper chaperone CopZ
MEQQQFKTNIKCGGCIATVTPFLNATAGENAWKVDTAAPEKVLTVSAGEVSAEAIIKAVEKAGFKAEKL